MEKTSPRAVTKDTVNTIKQFEGLVLKAYLDDTGLPTIGYGTIHYPKYFNNGRAVRIGDKITEAQADDFLMIEVLAKASAVEKLVKVKLNDNQFGSLVSFTYNLGEGSLSTSTLLRKININPVDPTITTEFLKWSKSKNPKTRILEENAGLKKRRIKEAALYFKAVKK